MLARRYNRKGITNVRYQACRCHFHSSLSSLDVLTTFVLFIDTDSVSFKKNLKNESLLLIEQNLSSSLNLNSCIFVQKLCQIIAKSAFWSISMEHHGPAQTWIYGPAPPNKPESPGTSSPGMVNQIVNT